MNLDQTKLRTKLMRLRAIARNNKYAEFFTETKKVMEDLEMMDMKNKDKIEDSLDKAYKVNQPVQATQFIDEALREIK